MAKWFGAIGYAVTRETAPGVFTEIVEERKYYGDMNRIMKRYETGESLNDDISISNELSIVADAFAYQNFHAMRYVDYLGGKWKVKSVEVAPPRLNISIGGVYNEQ